MIDLGIGTIIGFFLVQGMFRGGVIEISGIGALVGGIWGALLLMNRIGDFIKAHSDLMFSAIIGFLIAFFLIYIFIRIVGVLLKQILDRAYFRFIDNTLGAIIGGAKGVLIVLFLLVFLSLQPFIRVDDIFDNSILYKILRPLTVFLLDIVRERILGV